MKEKRKKRKDENTCPVYLAEMLQDEMKLECRPQSDQVKKIQRAPKLEAQKKTVNRDFMFLFS